MAKKKENIEEPEKIESLEPQDKSVISSEEVEEVVLGDEEALSEQMEKIKNLTKEQQIQALAEEKKRQEELAKKKQEDLLKQQQQALADEKLRAQRQQEAALLAQKQAEEERIKKQKELEAQKQLQQQQLLQQQQQQEAAKKASTQQQPPQPAVSSAPPQPKAEPPKNTDNKNDGPTTFKRVMAGLLFISLMAMIYFLPEITNYVNELKDKSNSQEITSGVLSCKNSKTSEKLDIDIEALFYFTNKELTKLSYTTIHTGDKTDDADELNNLYNDCLALKDEAGKLDGVTISCSLNNGVNSSKQILDYEKLDLKDVTSAYTEAGGNYPAEFKKSESIDTIESEMTNNNYTCSKS